MQNTPPRSHGFFFLGSFGSLARASHVLHGLNWAQLVTLDRNRQQRLAVADQDRLTSIKAHFDLSPAALVQCLRTP